MLRGYVNMQESVPSPEAETFGQHRRLFRRVLVIVMLWFGCENLFLATVRGDFQGSTHMMPFDEETIAYSKSPAGGPVTELQKKIDRGELTLEFDEHFGYLKALLKAFKVPDSSQMLVFSKTSLQRDRISPRTPRAVFFNDDV